MFSQPPSRKDLRTSAHPVPVCSDGITIAITNWNHEYVLPRSILSALQAVKVLREYDVPADVLVVDDQSRDGSLPLLRQLEALHYDDGLRVMALTRNGGLGRARNHALLNANYHYILFLDADNELVPQNVYQFYRAITQTRAAVVYGNLIRLGDTPDEADLISNESFQDRMFSDNYIDAFSLADRLQLIDCGGYLTDLMKGREDWELYLHLASGGRRIIFVPLVLGIYYKLAGSLIEETDKRVKPIDKDHDLERPLYQRMFNQLGVRDGMALNTRHLRYHPDIGYL